MKKVCCIIALAAFSLSTVFAYADAPKSALSADTVKKVKHRRMKVKKHKMKMKDTSSTMKM